MATDNTIQIFSSGMGYGYIIGVGFAFAFVMCSVSWILKKYFSEVQDSEMLMTAKRSIKTGLTASAVVSSWTIGSTLLLSCTETYLYGVASAWWYGAGACVQIVIFCTAAIELKRRAPNAHTFQEALRVRYDTKAHIVSLAYSLGQQTVYSANLLINGASLFSNLTGMSNDAAIVLFPIGVIVYTLLGGIKATFLTDWTHSVIIYALMLTFSFKCYATSDAIGSPGRLYDLLEEVSEWRPAAGNKEGSYLTFDSRQSGLFGLVLFGAGWAASVDSQLFQKAIACDIGKPGQRFSGVLTSYTLGSLCWFTIPFVLATTLGLACAGLEGTEYFPTRTHFMTAEEVSAGLVMPYGAYALLGKSGMAMVLTMVFMAVTAAFSSEVVAVSSLITYDIYKNYFNKKATGKTLIFVSHSGVILFGAVAIGLGIGLAHAGFDVSFITTVSGIVVNVCVIPMGCTLFWSRMTSFNFVCSCLCSSGVSIAVWLGYTAHQSNNNITLVTLSTNEALAAGNTVAIFVPVVFIPIFYFLRKPKEGYDWSKMLTIQQDDNVDIDKENGLKDILSAEEETERIVQQNLEMDNYFVRQRNYGAYIASFLIFFYLIIMPLPMYGLGYVFTKWFFTGWVVVMFIWGFFATCTITLLPLYESLPGIRKLMNILINKTRSKAVSSEEGSSATSLNDVDFESKGNAIVTLKQV